MCFKFPSEPGQNPQHKLFNKTLQIKKGNSHQTSAQTPGFQVIEGRADSNFFFVEAINNNKFNIKWRHQNRSLSECEKFDLIF